MRLRHLHCDQYSKNYAMNTQDRPVIEVPTSLAQTLIKAAMQQHSAKLTLPELLEADLDLLELENSEGTLSDEVHLLFAPIRESRTPLTLYSLSPTYKPSYTRRLCAFIGPKQTTVFRSTNDPTQTTIYLVDTEEVPHIVAANSPIFTRQNFDDGPASIPTAFIDAANHADVETAKDILLGGLESPQASPAFLHDIQKNRWEYTIWTSWRRTSTDFHAHTTNAALSMPSGTYMVNTVDLPENYLTHTPGMLEKIRKPNSTTEVACYNQTMLWMQLASQVAP